MNKIFSALLLLLINYANLMGQVNLDWHELKETDGLPSNYCYQIEEDNKGILWLATLKGLARYDGYRAVSVPNDTISKPVYSLKKFDNGIFWLASESGLQIFDPETEIFFDNLLDSVGPVYQIIELTSKEVLVTTKGGIYHVYKDRNQFPEKVIHYSLADLNDNLSEFSIFTIFPDQDDNLYISIPQMGVLKGKSSQLGNWEHFKPISFEQTVNQDKLKNCLAIRKISETELLMNFGLSGLFIYNTVTESLVQFFNSTPGKEHTPDCYVSATKVSPDGNSLYAFSSKHGLYNINLKETKKVSQFIFSSVPTYNPLDNIVHKIQIKKNTIWLNTLGDGLKYAELPKKAPIDLIPVSIGEYENSTVNSIVVDKFSNIWMATYRNGLVLIKSDSNKNTTTTLMSGLIKNYQLSQSINTLCFDQMGNLWIGSINGLGVLTRQQLKQLTDGHEVNLKGYFVSEKDQYSLNSNVIFDVFENSMGQIFVATENGINLFDEKNDRFLNEKNTENKIFNLESKVYYIDSVGKNQIFSGYSIAYISTDSSVNNNLDWFKEAIVPFTVYDVVPIDKKLSWLATNKGLYKFNQLENKLISHKFEKFFSEIRINAMNMDQSNILWMGTNQGLISFNTEEEIITQHAIPLTESNLFFQYGSTYKTDEELLFATNKGIVKIGKSDPESKLTDCLNECDLVVSILNSEGRRSQLMPKKSEDDSILKFPQLTIDNDQIINLELAFPVHHFGNKVTFEYSIKDKIEKWIKVNEPNPSIVLHNLSPGDYSIKIRAIDSKVKLISETILPVFIKPPWYQTRLAYFIYLMIIILMMISLIRYKSFLLKAKHSDEIRNFEKEKQLELDRIKLDLVSSISHEFNVPLTLILNQLNTLNDHQDNSKLLSIKRNGQRLKRLASELRDIGKLEKRDLRLMVQEHDIITLIRETTWLFTDLIKQKDITFHFESFANRIPVWLNHDQIEKVICNIISNAIKFTPSGGTLKITVEEAMETKSGNIISQAQVVIEDTGAGIQMENLEKIYDFGFTTTPSQDTVFNSTGIGLHVSKQIMELHHGSITIESELKKGTKCTLKLPLGNAHYLSDQILKVPLNLRPNLNPSRQGLDSIITDKTNNLQKSKILVVDDSPEIQEFLKSILNIHYEVIFAHNGLEGIGIAKSVKPDLIITDLAMPRKNGFYLIKKLKDSDLTRQIPIIVLTAFNSDDKKIHVLNEGVDAFIAKPFEGEIIHATVRNILTSRKNLEKAFSLPDVIGEELIQYSNSDLLKRVITIVRANFSDPDFDVQALADKLRVSRSYLYQKFSESTDFSPKKFIHIMRVRKGARLLKTRRYRVNEIAAMIGYNTLKNFRKYFKEYYGVSPSEYLKNDHL